MMAEIHQFPHRFDWHRFRQNPWQNIKLIGHEIQDDKCMQVASEMAYHLTLALFPALIAIFALFGLLQSQQSMDQIIEFLSTMIPPETSRFLQNLLNNILQGSSGGLAILSFLGALWAASNGTFAIMRGLNRAYDIPEEKTSTIRQRVKAVIATLALGILLFIVTNALILGDWLLQFLPTVFPMSDWFWTLMGFVRWLVIGLGVLAFAAIIYAILPSFERKISWTSTLPGALFFIVFWFIASQLFSFYVENFGKYNEVYGAIGVFIVLMIWLYITSLLLLIGGEINALPVKKSTA